jgi:hypothetical protein
MPSTPQSSPATRFLPSFIALRLKPAHRLRPSRADVERKIAEHLIELRGGVPFAIPSVHIARLVALGGLLERCIAMITKSSGKYY